MSEKNGSGAAPARRDLPPEQTWDLTKLYASDEAWERDFSRLEKEIETRESPAGRLAEGGAQVLAACTYVNALTRDFEKIYTYSHMKHDEDTAESAYTAMKQRALGLYAKLTAKIAFFRPELNALAEETLARFFEDCPELEDYRHFLAEIRLAKAHTLSDGEELLLAKATALMESPMESFGILSDSDLRFPDLSGAGGERLELTQGRFTSYLELRDRRFREAVFGNYYGVYRQFRNTFASLLSGNVKVHNYLADVRGFKTAREAALFENAIPETVYENLVKTVRSRLPLLHRYVALRKKILGVETLRAYDLYVPLTRVDLSYTFDEAKDILLKALAPLGEDYLGLIRRAFDERWIDVPENRGKRSGAYSGGCYDSPPYILLNWLGTLDNLFTLAHELGHSVHSYLSRSRQPYVYSDYSIFLAEIASTTNENLLTAYLLAGEADAERRRHYINHYLDGFKGTVFRQTQFAEFEQRIHVAEQEGEALTADFLSALYGSIHRDYYGAALDFDEEIALEWARIPHFYYNFYVYQYATGFSAATAFAARILAGEAGAVERYLGFLSAGSSAYPLDVLKAAGLDMSQPEPIEAALASFERYLGLMEEALD